MNQKYTIRFTLKARSETAPVFKKGWPPGVLAVQEVEYTCTPEEYASPSFAANILDQTDEFKNKLIAVDLEDITNEEDTKEAL